MSNLPIPRGIEDLLKKAAADPAFRESLLSKRAAAAEEAGVELTESEVAMLNDADPSQLESMLQMMPSVQIAEVQEMPFADGPLMVGGSRPAGPLGPIGGPANSWIRIVVLVLILLGLVVGVVVLSVFMSK